MRDGGTRAAVRMSGGGERETWRWGWLLALGVLTLMLGIVLLGLPLAGALTAATAAGAALMLLGAGGIAVGAKAARPERRLTDIALGVIAFLVGVYCFAFPLAGAVSLAFAIGFWLVVRGILEFVAVFRTHRERTRLLLLVSGLLDVVIGALLLANYPFPAVQMLGIGLAISLIFAGVATVIGALGLRRAQVSR